MFNILQIGYDGILALSKLIKTNSVLTSIYWDDNGTTIPGYLITQRFINFLALQQMALAYKNPKCPLSSCPIPIVDIEAIIADDSSAILTILPIVSQMQCNINYLCKD